ncbi:dual OB domain-containing protein [Saccharothrix stipae]
MAVIKQILCLANSRKHNGRCVAGVELVNGFARWIRPVSDRVGHEVSATERQYRGEVEPRVLDVIAVPLIEHQPFGFQQENWLLDPTLGWRRVRRATWRELLALEQRPGSLWVNGYNTSAGANDCVPVEREDAVVDSLKLIRVESATIEVKAAHRNATDQRPTVRARFRHSGTDYALKVTDPVYEDKFRSCGLGDYQLGECFLTVSLGEAFKGHFYKLVAAIVERGGPGTGSRR